MLSAVSKLGSTSSRGAAESTSSFLSALQTSLRARAILLVFNKNLLVPIYSKLHSKSCDYLY